MIILVYLKLLIPFPVLILLKLLFAGVILKTTGMPSKTLLQHSVIALNTEFKTLVSIVFLEKSISNLESLLETRSIQSQHVEHYHRTIDSLLCQVDEIAKSLDHIYHVKKDLADRFYNFLICHL